MPLRICTLFVLSFRIYAASAPVVPPASVVNNASFAVGTNSLAPGTIAAIFGSNLDDGTNNAFSSFDKNGELLTTLGGASVTFNGVAAPMFSAFPGQLNVQVPQLPPGQTQVQVITQCGTPQAQTSNAEMVTIQATAPEFFYYVHTASGKNPIAAINAVTHTAVGATGLVAGGNFTPAQRGELLTLFATGFGATAPSYGPGELPTGAAQVTAPVSITFGGVKLPASDILYVGVTENAGLYQVNLRVPNQVPDGDQSLVITIGGSASPAGGFVTVKGGPTSAQ